MKLPDKGAMIPERASRLFDQTRGSIPELCAVDGPPGSGKTTEARAALLEDTEAWGATFSRTAAAELKSRAGPSKDRRIGTIYSLCWPGVKSIGYTVLFDKKNQEHLHRSIVNAQDPALESFEKQSPSRMRPARELLGLIDMWRPGDPVPFRPDELRPFERRSCVWGLGLIEWMCSGCPWPEDPRPPSRIVLDEAQDFGAVELLAALQLARLGGEARDEQARVVAYLDPGQAIYRATESGLPVAWEWASRHFRLQGGYRVGDDAATAATQLLGSVYSRPASTFRASHTTEVVAWDGASLPRGGDVLVLCRSRSQLRKAFEEERMTEVPVVSFLRKPNGLAFSTIHAAKGAEAEDVYVLAPPPYTYRALESPGSARALELKVLYVALTRARYRVFLPPEVFDIILSS